MFCTLLANWSYLNRAEPGLSKTNMVGSLNQTNLRPLACFSFLKWASYPGIYTTIRGYPLTINCVSWSRSAVGTNRCFLFLRSWILLFHQGSQPRGEYFHPIWFQEVQRQPGTWMFSSLVVGTLCLSHRTALKCPLVEILHFSYCSRWHLCGLWRTLGIVHRFSHCSSQSARCMFLVLRPIRDSTSLRNTFVRPSLTAVGRYMTVSTAMEAVYPCFVPPLVSCFVTICITHLIA